MSTVKHMGGRLGSVKCKACERWGVEYQVQDKVTSQHDGKKGFKSKTFHFITLPLHPHMRIP